MLDVSGIIDIMKEDVEERPYWHLGLTVVGCFFPPLGVCMLAWWGWRAYKRAC